MKTETENPQLYELARVIPRRLVEQKPGRGSASYVPHFVIEQILHSIVGPFDFELEQILRGHSAGSFSSGERKGETVEFDDVIVGVVYRLTVDVDGRRTTIVEGGSVEHAWKEPDDGARFKKATSDALKRCAMRLGLGLHLWCKREDQVFLARVLREAGEAESLLQSGEVPLVGVEDQGDELTVHDLQHEGAREARRLYGSDRDGTDSTDRPGSGPDSTGTEPDRSVGPVTHETPTPDSGGSDGLSGSKAPRSIEEAEANLIDAGLVDPPVGQVRLPTGTVIREPNSETEWSVATRKEFVAQVGNVDAAASLYVGLIEELLRAEGALVLPDSEQELGKTPISKDQAFRLLTMLQDSGS